MFHVGGGGGEEGSEVYLAYLAAEKEHCLFSKDHGKNPVPIFEQFL